MALPVLSSWSQTLKKFYQYKSMTNPAGRQETPIIMPIRLALQGLLMLWLVTTGKTISKAF
jgi:hypothetical protein